MLTPDPYTYCVDARVSLESWHGEVTQADQASLVPGTKTSTRDILPSLLRSEMVMI